MTKGSRFARLQNQLKDWMATTDANLTFFGESLSSNSGLQTRQASNTLLVYCTLLSGNACAGNCSIYSGGPTCVTAHDTQCLLATNDVSFCNTDGCGNSGGSDVICHKLSGCADKLSNDFCYTPGTVSINVGI